MDSDEPRPEVAAPRDNSPTSANVRYYHSSQIENLSRLRFLDMEGENGGQPPRGILAEKIAALLQLIGITEYQEKRRKAVRLLSIHSCNSMKCSECIPRLSFVTSDIVIFVWNES